MYYTYVLLSTKDNKFYVRFSKDFKLRFEQHDKGIVETTRNRRPFTYETCINKDDATKREKYLKFYHGKMFFRKDSNPI